MSSEVSKRKKEGDEEDRISNLSDDLIHLILSFMNTKYAIQTCVLSKRWKSVWKSLPYLDFNHQTFPFNGDRRKRKFAKSVSLHKLIVKVLSRRHRADLVRVCYKSPYFEAHTLRELIAYAVDHNLKQLTIQLGNGWTSYFPESFYTCKSLTALQVFGKGVETMKSLRFLALPALKSLRIHGCSVSNESLYPDGCFPNLETLELTEIRCAEDNTFFYVVAPPNLKKLELSFSKDYEGNGCQVAIRAPRLMTFKYCGSASVMVYLLDDNLASLHDAYVDIHNWDIWISKATDSKETFDKFFEKVIAWIYNLKKFRHAESLTLSVLTFMALFAFRSLLDKSQLALPNLKYLKIKLEPGLSSSCTDELFEKVGCVLNSFRNSSTKVKYFV